MCEGGSQNNQKRYWKLLKKLDKCNKDMSDLPLPDSVVIDHYKDILTNDGEILPGKDCASGPLDNVITEKELRAAMKVLKNGKLPGMDNILNEMIYPLVDKYPQLILKLFNKVFSGDTFIKDWLISIILNIHKKDSECDMNNYRGISIMSCLGKLFLSILNIRLTKYALDNKILGESQLGFVPGNRTSDALLILHNLIQKYCHKKNQKIYGCFVDFSKAFDSISRSNLLQKLQKIGVTGKFFNIIHTLYTEDTTGVKIRDGVSDFFKPNRGVRQGCVLSPLLFNIYIADLQEKLDSVDKIKISEDKEISSIFWADDILLLSESKEGLQAKLDTLNLYAKSNSLQINTDKTECMIFNKTGRLLSDSFHVGGIQLKIVRQYKYLGFLVTPSGSISAGLEDLRVRALRGYMKLRTTLGSFFKTDIHNVMVKPIILYASDFWGCLKLPKNNPVEKLHNLFCKQLLGVQKQTNTTSVLLELGMTPLSLFALKYSIKNWDRIKHGNSNSIVKESLLDAEHNNLKWITSIQNLLLANGLGYLLTDENPQIGKEEIVFNRLKDQFNQTSFAYINSGENKLAFYGTLKKEIGMEKYLTEIRNIEHRKSMTKLRMSNHLLNIEKGRHMGLPRGERTCPFCPPAIEDEQHFLLKCDHYKHEREILLEHVPIISKLPNDLTKTVCLMLEHPKVTAKFIHQAFHERTLYMDVSHILSCLVSNVEKLVDRDIFTVTEFKGLKMKLERKRKFKCVLDEHNPIKLSIKVN